MIAAALLLLGTPGQAAAPSPPPPPPLATPPASIETPAPPRTHAKGDPLEHFNRTMFDRQQKFDRSILRPAALGYRHVVPKAARSGLRNFFANLGEPIVFLNYLLQLKPGKAAETAGRFAINSTLGLGGLIDIAKSPGVRLPHRPNGFGDTLALYGVGPGPYLFLPFVGPTTLRDLIGGQGDGLVLPLAVGKPFDRLAYQLPKGIVTGLDRRAEADDDLTALFAGAVDPYATLRSVYLQDRQGEIDLIRGKPRAKSTTPSELGDSLADPAAPPPAELSDPLADPAVPPKP